MRGQAHGGAMRSRAGTRLYINSSYLEEERSFQKET